MTITLRYTRDTWALRKNAPLWDGIVPAEYSTDPVDTVIDLVLPMVFDMGEKKPKINPLIRIIAAASTERQKLDVGAWIDEHAENWADVWALATGAKVADKRPKMTKASFCTCFISSRDGGGQYAHRVDGYITIDGTTGIHGSKNGGWAITDIATGQKIGGADTKNAAIDAIPGCLQKLQEFRDNIPDDYAYMVTRMESFRAARVDGGKVFELIRFGDAQNSRQNDIERERALKAKHDEDVCHDKLLAQKLAAVEKPQLAAIAKRDAENKALREQSQESQAPHESKQTAAATAETAEKLAAEKSQETIAPQPTQAPAQESQATQQQSAQPPQMSYIVRRYTPPCNGAQYLIADYGIVDERGISSILCRTVGNYMYNYHYINFSLAQQIEQLRTYCFDVIPQQPPQPPKHAQEFSASIAACLNYADMWDYSDNIQDCTNDFVRFEVWENDMCYADNHQTWSIADWLNVEDDNEGENPLNSESLEFLSESAAQKFADALNKIHREKAAAYIAEHGVPVHSSWLSNYSWATQYQESQESPSKSADYGAASSA